MGRQIYVSDEHHKKLKMISSYRGEDMKSMAEEWIESLDVDGEEYNEQLINAAEKYI